MTHYKIKNLYVISAQDITEFKKLLEYGWTQSEWPKNGDIKLFMCLLQVHEKNCGNINDLVCEFCPVLRVLKCLQYLEKSSRLPTALNVYPIKVWLSVIMDLFSFWMKDNWYLRTNSSEQGGRLSWTSHHVLLSLFLRFYLLSVFWIAGLLNWNRTMGCYLDNLHFLRTVCSFITPETYLLLHPTQCGNHSLHSETSKTNPWLSIRQTQVPVPALFLTSCILRQVAYPSRRIGSLKSLLGGTIIKTECDTVCYEVGVVPTT